MILKLFGLNQIARNDFIKFSCVLFRGYSVTTTSAEKDLTEILKRNFPKAKSVVVEDISGGCGAMYNVYVESIDLKGLSVIKQHQAVTNALKEQIKSFHGIRIQTKIPES